MAFHPAVCNAARQVGCLIQRVQRLAADDCIAERVGSTDSKWTALGAFMTPPAWRTA